MLRTYHYTKERVAEASLAQSHLARTLNQASKADGRIGGVEQIKGLGLMGAWPSWPNDSSQSHPGPGVAPEHEAGRST